MAWHRIVWLQLGLALSALGCKEAPAAPVGRFAVEPAKVTLERGKGVELRASFEPTAPLVPAAGLPQVFVHVLEANGEVTRTFDHPLPGTWQVGTPLHYPIRFWQSLQDPPLAPGEYAVTFGLYDRATGKRWALDTQGKEKGRQEYQLAAIEVPPGGGGAPQLSFGDGWLRPEETLDRQILMHRWLGKGGKLTVAGLAGPIHLELRLRIPDLPPAEQRLVLDEGASGPALTVSSACLAAPAEVKGLGDHTLELDLTPAAGAGECVLDWRPTYVYVDLKNLIKRSVDLGVVLWRPA